MNWRNCWVSSVRVVGLRHNGALRVAVLGFVAVVVGTKRLKTSLYEIDNTTVPPSIQLDSVSLSASESQWVFTCGRIKTEKFG